MELCYPACFLHRDKEVVIGFSSIPRWRWWKKKIWLDLRSRTPQSKPWCSSRSWPAPIPRKHRKKTFTQHLMLNGRNKMWEMQFQFESFRSWYESSVYLRRRFWRGQNSLVPPPAAGNTARTFSAHRKTRSHFCLRGRKHQCTVHTHTEARCQRGSRRKRQNWISLRPPRVTDTTRQKFGRIFSHIFVRRCENKRDMCNYAGKKSVFNNSKYAFIKVKMLNIKCVSVILHNHCFLYESMCVHT